MARPLRAREIGDQVRIENGAEVVAIRIAERLASAAAWRGLDPDDKGTILLGEAP
jgi:hypothetical protein